MHRLYALAIVCALGGSASAQSPCRTVEVAFQPVDNLQIAVWIEDANGKYLDTAYVSRLTGSLGLANRPGNHLFKTDFRFPYGRRDMVLPIWAHARNHPYGFVAMGGQDGNSPMSCMTAGIAGSECDDFTIGYHFSVSSPEPFYCSPRGGVTTMVNGIDVVSCASGFYGSKGAYSNAPAFSLYPPRADLTSFVDGHDGPDARAFSTVNDLGAISGATPIGSQVINPPIRWTPPADGSYVLKVELSQESDFNLFHNHPNVDDEHAELNGYGHPFLGQPSVVYAVPFTVGATADVEVTSSYIGYSTWDGSDGVLHLPDMTITDTPGTGAGRLLDNADQSGSWRVQVQAQPTCGGAPDGGMSGSDGGVVTCQAPAAPTALKLTPHSSSIELSFASGSGGAMSTRFDVRYREGGPITDANFLSAIPSSTPPPQPGAPGATVSSIITGLRSQIQYYVAVRALSMCDAASPIATANVTTQQASFVTLHGCFIATAAYGSPLASELGPLRALRDRHLLTNPLGQIAVAAYYSLSPPIAAAIASDEHLRAAARKLVAPLVTLGRAVEVAERMMPR